MCGIIAYRAFDGRPIDKNLLKQMNRTQFLRGPDHSDAVVFDNGKIGLAHTRLSIIDLSERANQPMSTPDKKHWIVFNGEVYNFKEVRKALVGIGHRFQSNSDTEVILIAIKQWGIDALKRIEGIFSFVYVDMVEGYFLAARDRVGVKPLSYFKTDNSICFASTLSPLKLLPDFSSQIDPVARFEMLTSKYIVTPRSIYKKIRKVEPGTWMRVSFFGNISVGQYWSLESYLSSAEKYRDTEYAENENSQIESLKSALRKSINRQLIADVPVGVFLSGGVDSALIAAIACEQSGERIKSFTVGYDVKEYDESEDARETAKILGTDHHELIVTPEQVIDTATSITSVYDEPFGDASAIPSFLISRFAAKSVKVVLSGDGGDEQFFGYTRYHRLAFLYRLLRLRPEWFKKIITLMDQNHPRSIISHSITATLAYPDETLLYTHYMLENFSQLTQLAGGGSANMLWLSGHYLKNLSGYTLDDDFKKGMMYADMLNYLPDDCLTKVDRASMANSLEVRVPLLDENVLKASLNLPISMKWKSGQGKYIAKMILGDYLPKEFLHRPKKGFGIPLNKWLFNEMKDYTMDLLTKKNLEKSDLNPIGVEKIIAHHQSGRYDHQYFIWPLCCYVAWYLSNA